jgi:hypothetical protein
MPETEQERSGQIVSYQNRTRLLASNTPWQDLAPA